MTTHLDFAIRLRDAIENVYAEFGLTPISQTRDQVEDTAVLGTLLEDADGRQVIVTIQAHDAVAGEEVT
jgi:hypothetical protein